jgi:hypothetical protein
LTLLDGVLVAAGRSYAGLSARDRSPDRARLVILALVLVSVLAALAISLISIPSEKTFDDLRERRYRGLEWIRLEGDLQHAGRHGGRYVYVLRDPANEADAVTVYAPGPLPTGRTQVTGRARTDARLPGTFDTFYADAVTEPARHDPWLLIATPGLIALFLMLGARVGYPVVRRRDRPAAVRAGQARLAANETTPARWSGRLQGEERPLDDPGECTIRVDGDGEARTLTVSDDDGSRTLIVQRSSPKPLGRVCRVRGCNPHLEVHGPGSDLLFEFGSAGDRDRVAASLS